MFPDICSGNILKNDDVGYFSKIFIEIFERTFLSVAGKDKLEKYLFKYSDLHFIILTYDIIVLKRSLDIF